ncbi:MAG: magnesium chelatase [Candidatus Melainabacteria bacterium]|nr:MAG: magnesium chelatase [Candidatus Melainabacteria bacterium]
MVNIIKTATAIGINAYEVSVETDVVNSLPAMSIVGLPDASINEARDRVRSAIKNSGYSFPSKKVVVNLAPADLKKIGTSFDLPIAIGILTEEEVLDSEKLKDYAFIGELSLDGTIRAVAGVLPLVLGLKEVGIKNVIVPKENAKEAALNGEVNVYGATHLTDVVNHFTETKITPTIVDVNAYLNSQTNQNYPFDFKDVKGQHKAKKALEIAAAGGHNLLMIGSPGSGKTLMAKCFASILPPLELSEALELTKIYSICGLLPTDEPLMVKRPYRSVHHTASANGIIGGGSSPKPGEITLANRGVLFLDEMVEFPRQVLEVLRQPLEDGEIVISRAKHSVKYPAKFMLLGAMNPCPCGFLGDKEKQCTCSDFQINRYLSKLSGPLLDRIDIQVDVPRLTPTELLATTEIEEDSATIRKRVIAARKIQAIRYKNDNILTNSELTSELIKKYCQLDSKSQELMKIAIVKYQLSGRRYDRVLKLARTIADLANSENIQQIHLMQALQYKMFNIENYTNK